jgi:hypothetical protein
MDPSKPNSREYQRQAIDSEIKLLEESIRALKYRRNALAPVSSLPTEVIDAIFLFARVRVSASSATPSQRPDPLAWLRVSHVCHQWREIALNQPLLWNHVNFTALSSAGAAEILARAKTGPLYLEARFFGGNWNNDRYHAFQEELQVCVSRTRHLLISANCWNLCKTLDSLVSPAPALESLSLSSGRHFLQPDIPDTLFGGATPRLSCLKLRNCNISWKSPLLKGLRHLQILIPSLSIDMMWSLEDLLDALEEMPQLKTLTLHDAFPVADPFPFNVKRLVTLPSLAHFNIAASPRDCAFALAHLQLPGLICLCLQSSFSILDGEEEREVLLPYVLRHAHTQPLQSMLIRGNNRRIDILAWLVPNIDNAVDEPHTSPAATPPAHVALSLRSNDWNSFEDHLEFLDTVLAALRLDNLITLIAQDFKAPFEKFWQHSSLKWPLLRRVRLTPVAATRFTDWLLADKGGCEGPLLPSLKELVMVDAQLNECRTRGLRNALMKRVKLGVPLETLDLRTCPPDPANPGAVQLLNEIVVDVLGPEETLDARAQIISMWSRLYHRLFKYDISGNAYPSEIDDDYDDLDTGSDEDDEE